MPEDDLAVPNPANIGTVQPTFFDKLGPLNAFPNLIRVAQV